MRRLLRREKIDSQKSGLENIEPTSQGSNFGAKYEMRGRVPSAEGMLARGGQKPARKEAAAAVKPLPSPAVIEKALTRIKAILGNWFYAEVKARNLIQKPASMIQSVYELWYTPMRLE
jgi:hypothetical protein